MSDFNNELYFQQKAKYAEQLRNMLAGVDGNSQEDMNAFFNVVEDFYFDDIPSNFSD